MVYIDTKNKLYEHVQYDGSRWICPRQFKIEGSWASFVYLSIMEAKLAYLLDRTTEFGEDRARTLDTLTEAIKTSSAEVVRKWCRAKRR